MPGNEKVAIIGAGVGGLAAGARLSYRGYKVEVFEKLPRCGGRNNIIEDKGFKFDTGPSFILMPSFFKEIFSYCNQNLEDYLEFKALDINYKIFYADGSALTIHKDIDKTAQELEKIEAGSTSRYKKLLHETEQIYKTVEPLLYNNFSPLAVLNPHYFSLITKISAFKSYWQLVKKFFRSDKLCFAFTFQAMFMGVSPFEAPAFYSVITYADHVQKIYHPMGGMYQIPLSLEKMALNFGAEVRYNSEAEKIEKKGKRFVVKFDNGEDAVADKVIINADLSYAKEKLLNEKIPDYRYSCSVLLIYLGLKKKIPQLAHHNLFFSRDIRKNLSQIFKEKDFPQDPSFYIHVPTVTDFSLAPQGKEIVYILIPVPNLKKFDKDIKEVEEKLKQVIFNKLKQVSGENIEDLVEVERYFYPQDFISRYNIKYGATFGLSHNFAQSAFFRPSNRDSKFKNLYFVGASTQPGGGLPPVIASSRIVTDIITKTN